MNISNNIKVIRSLIKQTENSANRKPDSVLLLAVSKQQTSVAISEAFEQGITDFGENYFQEAEKKIAQLKNLPIRWHFIGPVQSNKAKNIAPLFTWVHTIDRIKVATLLSESRPSDLPLLNVCLQINLTSETTKSGISCDEAMELADAVSQLPNIHLRGLMTIPPPLKDAQQQYQLFLQLNQLMQLLNQQLNLNMDTLSMGMSDDLVPAIQAGATIVRIGQAIFGTRQGTSR
ncbi:YggS family pyridoxal phosphate-dependent enzyme [uncultured Legionella sp.]|uniref:YggS family pyridoxal phosphate-dependent enzyme n=1 Tax=uncultured Legionella sp. TaxID=210934 RepID=UPI0026122F70|nr:YggS family pyridoxal phosphate-dependent enzyme [uncultured Legionella sp.]